MIDYRKGREIASDVGGTIRDNSIPLALIGAGLGWFIVSSLQDKGSKISSGSTNRHPAANDMGANAAGANDGSSSSSGMSQRLNEYTGSAQEAAQGAYQSVKTAAGSVWSTVSDHGRSLSETAGGHADRAYGYAHRTFGDMVTEQPLLLGATGLIIGAALGAVLPNTSYENELIGDTRDDLARTVKDFGREQYDKAQRVVERTIETAKEEVERQGFTMDSAREAVDEIKERATNVAHAVADTAKTEAGIAKPDEGKESGGAKSSGGAAASGQAKPATGSEPQRGNDMTSGTPGSGTGGASTPGATTPKRGNDMTS